MEHFRGFSTDVRQQGLQFRIGHGVPLAQIAQRRAQLAVRTTVLADNKGRQLGVGIGDAHGVLQLLFFYKRRKMKKS